MSRITDFDTADIRFPTSLSLDGSDAMNPDPDYSAAYVQISTDAGDAGHGFVFTIGRGNEVEKLARLCREAVEDGFDLIKLKVGGSVDDDVRRLRIARDVVGPNVRIAVDANQRWEVAEAIDWMRKLQPYDIAWIEEPTNPDDVLGHAAIARGVAPIPVATGEHVANRVMFKQFLQAEALQVLQIDATRVE
jgi:L-fuconate dehydratase